MDFVERDACRTIAVIGAGASGALTAVHLLRRANGGVRVVLIDPKPHGPGIAYSTPDPQHLLNVRAAHMSAFDDDPQDLLRWCAGRGVEAEPGEYLPRSLFGAYLQDLLRRFGGGGALELVNAGATSLNPVSGGVRVGLSDGRSLSAGAAVLALGHGGPTTLAGIAPEAPYVANPWAEGALRRVADASRLVIIGSGLTAVDVALSATAINPAIELRVVSRHGWLPRTHLAQPAPLRELELPSHGGVSLDALLAAMSDAILDDPSGWRGVVDGLRPRANQLWQGLSPDDRRRFLVELKSWWGVHRHRTAPDVGDRIERLRQSGQLAVEVGSFEAARPDGRGVSVEILTGSVARRLEADLVVNAISSPNLTSRRPDALVTDLLACGRVRPDELGVGFACDHGGALLDTRGRASRRLFTVGPPRRGELFESTAIPEIRSQANALAERLLSAEPRQRVYTTAA